MSSVYLQLRRTALLMDVRQLALPVHFVLYRVR